MKVNSYSPITQVMAKVTDKSGDKQGGAGSNAYQQQKKDEKDQNEFEPTLEAVEAAVETFDEDQTNLSHGITASTEGRGPGLKVVLKDASGGVLRSVSGEEFMKLREAVVNGQKSGRILDQKA